VRQHLERERLGTSLRPPAAPGEISPRGRPGRPTAKAGPPAARVRRVGAAAATREIRPGTHLRDGQLNRADARIPRAHLIPVAVSLRSGFRSYRSAPINPVTSVSMSACESTRMPSRSASPYCSSRSLPTNADRSILGVWNSKPRQNGYQADRHQAVPGIGAQFVLTVSCADAAVPGTRRRICSSARFVGWLRAVSAVGRFAARVW
jgi:hypothetical protein